MLECVPKPFDRFITNAQRVLCLFRFVTQGELSSLSTHMRGRLTLDKVIDLAGTRWLAGSTCRATSCSAEV